MMRVGLKLLTALAVLSSVNAGILFSELSPRDSQRADNGSVTLSAKIVETSNFIRTARFELRANGRIVGSTTVSKQSGPNVYSIRATDLSPGVEYCFQILARNRFFLSSSSGFTCFSIVGQESAPAPASTPVNNPSTSIRYGLQDDCFVFTPGQFSICLDIASPSGRVENWFSAFTKARNSWERVVTSNGIQFNPRQLDTAFTATGRYPEFIDGVYIASIAENIDGVGGVLGSAGPIFLAQVGNSIVSVTGRMRFDDRDIQDLINRGTWENVIEHEMGHVLGIGTLWQRNNLINFITYRGPAVIREWTSQGCRLQNGFAPIVETDGGPGTALGHWDEACFGDELMTGFIGDNTLFSRFTVATLEDLGYEVDYTGASTFNVPAQCCFGRRRLNDPSKIVEEEQSGVTNINPNSKRRRLSSRMMERAMDYGSDELTRLKRLAEDLEDRFGRRDFEVQAVDFVNVLVEEDGEIFDVIVDEALLVANGR